MPRHLIIVVYADDDSATLCVAVASSFLEKLWRDRGGIESQSFYCFTCRLVPRMKIVRDAIKGNSFFLLEIRYRELKLGSSNERTLVALVATRTLVINGRNFFVASLTSLFARYSGKLLLCVAIAAFAVRI